MTEFSNYHDLLLLASAVERYGDQNWNNISEVMQSLSICKNTNYRAKMCTAKFQSLLAQYEINKKTSNQAAISLIEILRKERIKELEALLNKLKQEYKKLQDDILLINSGNIDDKLEVMWQQIKRSLSSEELESFIFRNTDSNFRKKLLKNTQHDHDDSQEIETLEVEIPEKTEDDFSSNRKRADSNSNDKESNKDQYLTVTARQPLSKFASASRKKIKLFISEDKNEDSGLPSASNIKQEVPDDASLVESFDGTEAKSNIDERSKYSHSPPPDSPALSDRSDLTDDEKQIKFWRKSIMCVYKAVTSHKYANVFVHPVTEDIAPGYSRTVHYPMDLTTIKKKIDSGLIRTTSEFHRDLMLMYLNAAMYNHVGHEVHKIAIAMYKDVKNYIDDFINQTQSGIKTPIILHTGEPKNLRPFRNRNDEKPDDMFIKTNIKKRRPSVETQSPKGKNVKKKR